MFLRWFAKQAAEQTENLDPLTEYAASVELTGENATYYANLNVATNIETATTEKTEENVSIGTARNHVYTPSAGIKQSINAKDNGDWKFNSVGNNVTVISGDGADTVEILGAENSIDLGKGDNSISGNGANNTVSAGNGNDTLKLEYTAKNNAVRLGDGGNFISLTGSANTIITGAGKDTVRITKVSSVEDSATENNISTGAGDDSLNIAGSNNTIDAGAGDDTILNYSADSSIDGGAGNDEITISASNNTVNAGAGNDSVTVNSSNNILNGDEGEDFIQIQGANNTVYGGANDDTVNILSANNLIYGDAGNDEFYILAANNTIDGGAGKDMFYVAKSARVSDITIDNISAADDYLYFEDVIGKIERINDGIKATFANSNISVNIHFTNTSLPPLDNLEVQYTDGDGATVKKLSDFVSMKVFTGWKIENGNALYIIEDKTVATIGGLKLSGVTAEDGEIAGINFDGKNIVVSSNLIQDGITFDTAENYILKLNGVSGESIIGGAIDNIISFAKGEEDHTEFKIDGQGGKDSISASKADFENSTFEMEGGADDDTIIADNINFGTSGAVTISGADGNDSIKVKDIPFSSNALSTGDQKLSISGGDGNDTVIIENSAVPVKTFVTVGEGNNSISVSNSSIQGNTDLSSSDFVTVIESGAGDDTISLKEISVTNGEIEINEGNGANKFTANKITLNGGAFSVTGGADNDTISIEDINASGTGANIKVDALNGANTVTVKNARLGNTNLTVSGGADNDTISVENIFVTEMDFEVNAGGGENNISLSDGTAGMGDLKIVGGTNNDTISVKGMSFVNTQAEINGGMGTDSITVTKTTVNGGELDIEGEGVNDTITVSELSETNNATVNINALGGSNNVAVKKSTLSGGSFNLVAGGTDDTLSIEEISATETDVNFDAGNGLNDVKISRATLDGGTLNVTSGTNDDTISIEDINVVDSNVEIDAGAGVNSISVSDATLKGNGDFNIYGTGGTNEIALHNVTATENQTFNIYAGENDDLISIDNSAGVKVLSGDGKDTLAFGSNAEVTISDFAIEDIISLNSAISDATFDEDKGVLTLGNVQLTLEGVKDIYSYANTQVISGDQSVRLGKLLGLLEWDVTGTTATYGKEITITGVNPKATADDFELDGVNTVTISANALSKGSTVTISDGYNLALADDVKQSEETEPVWKVSGTTANYATSLTEGYYIEDNTINYRTAGDGTILTTVTGLSTRAKAKDFSLEDNTVTVAANAITKNSPVEITGDYTLALADDVIIPKLQPGTWKVTKGTATYNSGVMSAGYIVNEENQIVFAEATTGENTIKVTGLNTSAKPKDLKFDEETNTVYVSSSGLSKNNTVEITDGYNLGLADGVTVPTVQASTWKISNGTANYVVDPESAGYVVEDNKIVYKNATEGEIKITITGLKNTATKNNIVVNDSTHMVSIASSAVQGTVTVSEGYGLIMSKGTYSKSTVMGGTGNDTIYNVGNKLAINGGAGKDLISLESGTSGNTLTGGTGDDSIISEKGQGKNIYLYADGDGDDIFYGFTENDSLKITSGNINNWNIKGTDVIFNVGNGTITIKDGADKKLNTAVGKEKNVANVYTAAGTYNDKQTEITLNADFSGTYNVPAKPAVKIIDGSLTTNGVQVNGSAAANSIKGGNGKDTLYGGSGNDTIDGNLGDDYISGDDGNDRISGNIGNDTISGGKGNDTITLGSGADLYIYTAGNDLITDYAEEDKISLAGDKSSSVGISGKDISLKIGNNTLKIKNGLNKKITIDDETKIYEKNKIYNEARTAVTLMAAVTLENNLATVDGSAMTAALKYSASNDANWLEGGKGGDSILGNAGNDSIYGNAGNDKIWGGDGNDYIEGGAGNDTLNGGSGNDTLTGGAGNDTFNYEGGNDFITDYEAGKDKIVLSTSIKSASVSGTDVIFETANGKITVKDGAEQKITTVTKIGSKTVTQTQIHSASGTYNDKQTAITLAAGVSSYQVPTKPAIASVDGSATNGVTITGGSKADSIIGGAGKDILHGGNGNDTIFGGDNADEIYGDNGNDKLYGDAGNDTIYGGAGNDTFTGGAGADVFVYGGGNDVITDYAEEDKISIASGEVSSVGVSGKDVTFKVGSKTLKLKDALGKKITIDGKSQIYEKGKTYNDSRTSVTITAAATLESDLLYIDGSSMTSALKYQANSSDNTIIGGKGGDSVKGGAGRDSILGNDGNDKIWGELGNDYIEGGKGNDTLDGGDGADTLYGNAGNDSMSGGLGNDAIYGDEGNDKLYGDGGNDSIFGGIGNDTLYGGTGNNTLTGGDGNDVFVHEGGNDWIEDYSAGNDKIKFNAEITRTDVSGPHVIFRTADSGVLTINFAAGKEITYIDANNKTLKNTWYAQSAKTLDLLYDDNFMTDDFAIDDITEVKFEVQNIETQNNLEISQPVITYGEDKDK